MDHWVVELVDKHGRTAPGTPSLAPQAQCFVRAMEQLRKVELKVLLEKVQRLGGLEFSGKKATPKTIWQHHKKKLTEDGYLKFGPPPATPPAATPRCDDDAPLVSLARMPLGGSAIKKDPAKDGAGSLQKNGENQKASASDPQGSRPAPSLPAAETPRSNDQELPASKPAKASVIKTILKQKQKEEDREEKSAEPWKKWVIVFPKENLVRLDTGILPGEDPPRKRCTIAAAKLGGSMDKAKEVAERMAELINAGVEKQEWQNVRDQAYEEYASRTENAAGDSTERPTGGANIPVPKAKAKGKAKAKPKAKAATKTTAQQEKKLDEKVEKPEMKPDKKVDVSNVSKAEKKPDKAEGSKMPKEASKQAETAEGPKGPKTVEVPPTDAKTASCQVPKASASKESPKQGATDEPEPMAEPEAEDDDMISSSNYYSMPWESKGSEKALQKPAGHLFGDAVKPKVPAQPEGQSVTASEEMVHKKRGREEAARSTESEMKASKKAEQQPPKGPKDSKDSKETKALEVEKVSKEPSQAKDVPKERKESGTDRKEIKRAAELAKKPKKTDDEMEDARMKVKQLTLGMSDSNKKMVKTIAEPKDSFCSFKHYYEGGHFLHLQVHEKKAGSIEYAREVALFCLLYLKKCCPPIKNDAEAEQTEKHIGELRDQICENLFRAVQVAAKAAAQAARRCPMAKSVRQKAVAKAVAGPQSVAVKPTCPHCLQEYKGSKENHNKKCKGKVTCPDCGMPHSKRSELRHKKDHCGKRKSKEDQKEKPKRQKKEVKPESESPKKKQKTEAVNAQPVVQGPRIPPPPPPPVEPHQAVNTQPVVQGPPTVPPPPPPAVQPQQAAAASSGPTEAEEAASYGSDKWWQNSGWKDSDQSWSHDKKSSNWSNWNYWGGRHRGGKKHRRPNRSNWNWKRSQADEEYHQDAEMEPETAAAVPVVSSDGGECQRSSEPPAIFQAKDGRGIRHFGGTASKVWSRSDSGVRETSYFARKNHSDAGRFDIFTKLATEDPDRLDGHPVPQSSSQGGQDSGLEPKITPKREGPGGDVSVEETEPPSRGDEKTDEVHMPPVRPMPKAMPKTAGGDKKSEAVEKTSMKPGGTVCLDESRDDEGQAKGVAGTQGAHGVVMQRPPNRERSPLPRLRKQLPLPYQVKDGLMIPKAKAKAEPTGEPGKMEMDDFAADTPPAPTRSPSSPQPPTTPVSSPSSPAETKRLLRPPDTPKSGVDEGRSDACKNWSTFAVIQGTDFVNDCLNATFRRSYSVMISKHPTYWNEKLDTFIYKDANQCWRAASMEAGDDPIVAAIKGEGRSIAFEDCDYDRWYFASPHPDVLGGPEKGRFRPVFGGAKDPLSSTMVELGASLIFEPGDRLSIPTNRQGKVISVDSKGVNVQMNKESPNEIQRWSSWELKPGKRLPKPGAPKPVSLEGAEWSSALTALGGASRSFFGCREAWRARVSGLLQEQNGGNIPIGAGVRQEELLEVHHAFERIVKHFAQ